MIITQEQTLEKIKSGLYTSFKLHLYTTKNTTIKIADERDVDNDELLRKLYIELSRYPNIAKFKIEAKKKASVNDEYADVWLFSRDGSDPFQMQLPGMTPGLAGLPTHQHAHFGGFGALDISAHPVYQSLQAKEERLSQREDQIRQRETAVTIKEAMLEQSQKSGIEKLEAMKREMEESLKKYNSTSAATARALEMVIDKVISEFAESGTLRGLPLDPSGAAAEEPEPLSPEDQIVESIAVNISSHKLSIENLKLLGAVIERYIQKIKEKPTEENNKEKGGDDE
jgi:hypothetical protein